MQEMPPVMTGNKLMQKKNKEHIYLDYAAHTPADDRVLSAFIAAAQSFTANANSPHPPGQAAKARFREAAERIAALLHVKPDDIIFTSGASESNNLALKGAAENNKRYGKHIITTPLEHSSVNGPLAYLQQQGFEIDCCELNCDGTVDIDHLSSLLRRDTILVSVCWVDSELGIVQPIKDISAMLSGRAHCMFHTDATQAVGKIPISLNGIGLASFAPHKFYGLCGSGMLVCGENVVLEPQIHGGISSTPFRSGTPALELAVAAESALEIALSELQSRYQTVHALNAQLIKALRNLPGVLINSTTASVPHIVNLSLPGIKTDRIQALLGEKGIYVATRSACCAPGTVSRPVYALTHNKKAALSTMRISLSHLTPEEDIGLFIQCLKDSLEEYRGAL